VLESRYEECDVPSVGSHLVDDERMKPVGHFSWLKSLLWLSFVAVATGRAYSCKETSSMASEVTTLWRYRNESIIIIIVPKSYLLRNLGHTSNKSKKEGQLYNKNSSGDEIANVNFSTMTSYMWRPAPTPIEPTS